MKNPRTSIVGILLILIAFFGMLLVWTGRATVQDISTFLIPLFGIFAGVGLWMAKDANKGGTT